MKILITSGGTKIPIDGVRDITNMSKGTFGSKIAKEFMIQNHEVTFFHAKESKTPFEFNCNFEEEENLETSFQNALNFHAKYKNLYSAKQFRNFDDYQEGLWSLLDTSNFDVVILAAAVSDYGVTPVEGKIRSKNDLTINLYPLPKLISQVRKHAPKTFLVGFKLLVDSTENELIKAVYDSINNNDCDLVVGNDLSHIKKSAHTLFIGRKQSQNISVYKGNNLAKSVVNEVTRDLIDTSEPIKPCF